MCEPNRVLPMTTQSEKLLMKTTYQVAYTHPLSELMSTGSSSSTVSLDDAHSPTKPRNEKVYECCVCKTKKKSSELQGHPRLRLKMCKSHSVKESCLVNDATIGFHLLSRHL